jgi:beta-phosphoglucomutase
MDNRQQDAELLTPRCAIWDVDGTLIDSGPLHFETWYHTLREEGHIITHEQFAATFGQRNDAVLRAYLGSDLPISDIERIGGAKERLYREMVAQHGINPLPGVMEWLERLAAAGWKQAIASSAPRLNLQAIIAAIDIEHYFATVVSAEDVKHGKPDPEIFLLAAARLGGTPARSVVIEDAPAGVEGGRRAGMYTIGVLFSHRELDADIVVPTLDQLPPDTFERLVPQ